MERAPWSACTECVPLDVFPRACAIVADHLRGSPGKSTMVGSSGVGPLKGVIWRGSSGGVFLRCPLLWAPGGTPGRGPL
jgi:hypothetical protein